MLEIIYFVFLGVVIGAAIAIPFHRFEDKYEETPGLDEEPTQGLFDGEDLFL